MLAAIRMSFARRRAIDAPVPVAGSSRDDEQIELSAARAEIWTMMRIGGVDEARVRATLFVLGADREFSNDHGPDGRHDRSLRELAGRLGDPDRELFAKLVDDQGAVLCLDTEVAIESLPALLPDDQASGQRFMQALRAVVDGADGAFDDASTAETGVSQRFAQIRRIVSFDSQTA